jgi:hypothetical protein
MLGNQVTKRENYEMPATDGMIPVVEPRSSSIGVAVPATDADAAA